MGFRQRFIITISVLFSAANVAGCGDDNDSNKPGNTGGVGASGLPAGKTLGSLTPSERGTLCDWDNAARGGYGKTIACSDDTEVETDASQADCVTEMNEDMKADCMATVRDYEACHSQYLKDQCDISVFFSAAECQPVTACLNI